jgi:hypothetical protein
MIHSESNDPAISAANAGDFFQCSPYGPGVAEMAHAIA